MRQHSGSEVDAAVDDALLLFLLQDARYDGLRCDPVPAVVDHDRAQCVQARCVHCAIHSDALEIVALFGEKWIAWLFGFGFRC